jgi:LPS export ABC transporter protein LptC
MINIFLNTKTAQATLLVVALFFGCQTSLEEVKSIGNTSYNPVSTASEINTKYTDSGRLTMNLLSPKMVNFSNLKFPFYEFPDGIKLTLFDKDAQQTHVFANYAIAYQNTDLIDLRGNVILVTTTLDSLFTEQLYYNQQSEWLFTNYPVVFRTEEYLTNGNGFDANTDFTNAQVLEVTGRIYIKE